MFMYHHVARRIPPLAVNALSKTGITALLFGLLTSMDKEVVSLSTNNQVVICIIIGILIHMMYHFARKEWSAKGAFCDDLIFKSMVSIFAKSMPFCSSVKPS